jgi:hypothetical protein
MSYKILQYIPVLWLLSNVIHPFVISTGILEKHILCNAVHRKEPKEHVTLQHFKFGQAFSILTTYIFENNYSSLAD